MRLGRDAELARGIEQPRGVSGREQSRLAGDVVEGRDPLRLHRGQCLQHRRRVRAGVDSGGHDVSAEKRHDESERRQRTARIQQLELVKLVIGSQAIAGLDLERRHARREDPLIGRTEGLEQLVVGGPAGREHRRPDASAGGGDLGERRPVEPQLILDMPVTGEQRVRMTLDQPRQDRHPDGVQDRDVLAPLAQHLRGRTDRRDGAVADRDGAIRDQVQLALLGAAARTAAVGDARELCSVDDVEVFHDPTLVESVAGAASQSTTGRLRPA